LTVNVCPATVNVPLRVCPAGLAVALKFTLPFPDPLAPLVIVSHESLLVAVHAQPLNVVTAVEPVPPAAGTD